MSSSSGAGKAFVCRRRDSDPHLIQYTSLLLIFLRFTKVFSLLEPSRTLSNHLQQTGASPLSNNGRRAYLETFISEPVLSISFRYFMLAPSSTEPSNQRADSRSGSLLTLEEISPRTSLKARELSIGPSDAPCLGEASTAHDDYFFSVKLIHLKNGYGFEDLRPSSRPCSYAIIDESSHIGAHSLTAKLLNRSDKPPRSLRSVANRSKTRVLPRSQKLGRSLHLNGRRHHLREESPSLLRFFNYTLRTLDLVLILAKSYEPKSWKVYSLLFPIPNCWRIVCSYRSSVSKCSPMVAFAKDFKHRLNVISNKLIIMCSSPHSDLEDFSSVFENVLNRSFTVALPCLQPLLPDRNSSLAPSLTSRCLLTVTISPSFDLFMEARSTNRDLTCVQMLSSFGFKALMEPSSIYFSYLLVVLGYAPLCNAFLNFGIFAPMLSLYLNFC
ncbi:hypothetical protein ARALYDRAFT_895033 [Arabidopsis lyrata subsp. lyrata]|uniref:Uncharacterized protein n=1 Tax=Arabidopsis lyrata subsp. lyrata TaxID=81972 RepID=D7KYZ5_ARALL|nr:hypothetical protein ARALYDRAFT_895033 [Arabidopsis lyrata subsp. lyrata]